MARGGKREGAGRKPDPNSARQKRLAARKARQEAGNGVAEARSRSFTLPDGTKSPDAPPGWPFGRAPEAPAPAPIAPPPPAKRQTAREYLADVVNDLELDAKTRIDAAKKLIEFEEAKPAPVGKKQAANEAARKAAGSKFASTAPPKLAAVNGSRV